MFVSPIYRSCVFFLRHRRTTARATLIGSPYSALSFGLIVGVRLASFGQLSNPTQCPFELRVSDHVLPIEAK